MSPIHGFCPHCFSGWIRNRYGKRWDCRKCKAHFDVPLPSVTVIRTVRP